RDAVLAAQEDTAQVRALNALPDLELGLEHRGVVRGRDAGVVEEHVDAPVLGSGALHEGGYLRLVGDVGLDRQVPGSALEQIDADDRRALAAEGVDARRADAAAGAGDDADATGEPTLRAHCSVA